MPGTGATGSAQGRGGERRQSGPGPKQYSDRRGDARGLDARIWRRMTGYGHAGGTGRFRSQGDAIRGGCGLPRGSLVACEVGSRRAGLSHDEDRTGSRNAGSGDRRVTPPSARPVSGGRRRTKCSRDRGPRASARSDAGKGVSEPAPVNGRSGRAWDPRRVRALHCAECMTKRIAQIVARVEKGRHPDAGTSYSCQGVGSSPQERGCYAAKEGSCGRCRPCSRPGASSPTAGDDAAGALPRRHNAAQPVVVQFGPWWCSSARGGFGGWGGPYRLSTGCGGVDRRDSFLPVRSSARPAATRARVGR